MVQIRKAHFTNFRCLSDVEVSFDRVTTLIGPNGVGKSTVLHGLNWFFNGPSVEKISADDCTRGNTAEPISVTVEFSNMTKTDRDHIGLTLMDNQTELKLRRERRSDGQERMFFESSILPQFALIRRAGPAMEKRNAYKKLREENPSWNLPSANSAVEVENAMRAFELANPGKLAPAEIEVRMDIFGFDGSAPMSGVFDYVLVAADMRASDEVVDRKTSVIGRIVERAVDRTAADQELQAIAEAMHEQQDEVFAKHFTGQFEKLSTELTNAVQEYVDDRSVVVRRLQQPSIGAPKVQFEVDVADSELHTSVSRQGHGLQRTLLIAALQLLARHGSGGPSGTICLAIEEPELYQHPVQAKAFGRVLRSLAEDPDQRFEIMYATHSPHFISAANFSEVRRLTRRVRTGDDLGPTVEVRSTTLSKLKTALEGVVKESVIESQMGSVAMHRLPDALFASGVILVEGTTDRAVIEGVSERGGQKSVFVSGIVVAEVSSKGNLPLPRAILHELGIPVFTVFDGDHGVAHRMIKVGRSDQDIENAAAAECAMNRKLLTLLGAAAEDWPKSQVFETFAVLEDTLETFLEGAWPEWREQADMIAGSGLGDPRKNELLYLDASKYAAGEPPELLLDILERTRDMMKK
nr:AAA family ATPase [Nocardioides flavescens]